MGGGASSHGAFEQMLTSTMLLGDAIMRNIDPRFVRFPDTYRLYDFHVGEQRHPHTSFQGGNLVLFVHSPDSNGVFQQIDFADPDEGSNFPLSASSASSGQESSENYLTVYQSGDKILLDKRRLNQPNNDGWTPLHAACHTINGQDAGLAILDELVRQRANVDIPTLRGPSSFSSGWTPLHIATAYGLEKLAMELIRAGANVNTENSIHWTPLYEACHRGYTNVAHELLKAGAHHNVICPEFALCPYPGQYPLAEASRQGYLDTVKLLLEWGVAKNAVNEQGWTALHEAAYHSRVEIVKVLIVYGADVHLRTKKGSLAVELSIHSDVIAMLNDVGSHPVAKLAESGEGGNGSEQVQANREKKANIHKQLSRKEDYVLLGDLPQLSPAIVPSISIQSVDDFDENELRSDEHMDEKAANKKKTSSHKKKKLAKTPLTSTPNRFKCAISLKLLKHPVRSPFGHVFERHVIETWFHDFGNRCPLTGEPLTIDQLKEDEALKKEIQMWKQHGKQIQSDDLTQDEARPNEQIPTQKEEKKDEYIKTSNNTVSIEDDELYNF